MHLLVIEDDPRLSRLLKRLLEDDRHVVELATDGRPASRSPRTPAASSASILDIGLPDISGLEVARRLRDRGSEVADPDAHRARHRRRPGDRARRGRRRLPRQAVRLRGAVGATAGAGPPRRGRRDAEPSPKLVVGPIELDETARRVTVDGTTVDLSPREFSLLECLLRHPGQTLSRDQLLDQAWPFGVAVTPNAVDAYVHYLRDKLGRAGRLIETVRGVGYRLADA